MPLSDAVARSVPALLSVIQERGERCASATLTASSLSASKRRTSPLVGGMWEAPGGACDGGANDEGRDFCGRGYAT